MSSVWRWMVSSWAAWMAMLGFGSDQQVTCVILGLDNAGKTSFQYKLRTGRFQQFLPTQRAKSESVHLGNLHLNAWDLGGHSAARHLWTKYAQTSDGVLFIVDAADRARADEAKQELHRLIDVLARFAPQEGTPVAILANKCDLPTAMNMAELQVALDLDHLLYSPLQGTGYIEALQWIARHS